MHDFCLLAGPIYLDSQESPSVSIAHKRQFAKQTLNWQAQCNGGKRL